MYLRVHQGNHADDHFRRVAERGIQQPAQRLIGVRREGLGCGAEECGERDEASQSGEKYEAGLHA